MTKRFERYDNETYYNVLKDNQTGKILADAGEIAVLLNNSHEENNQLKNRIEFLFKQIKAFRSDCVTYNDFDGASTLNRLIEILNQSMELEEWLKK